MRHGQTLFNQRKKIQGFCDAPLTELGVKQAKIAGSYFKSIRFLLIKHIVPPQSEQVTL